MKKNNTDITTEVFRSVKAMEQHREKWNEIISSGAGEVSQLYEWYKALEEGFCGSKELYYLALSKHSQLKGVLPVLTEKARYRKIPARKASFISNIYCNHNDLIMDSDSDSAQVLRKVIPELHTFIGGWDVLEIDEVQADSPRMDALEQICAELGYNVYKRNISNSPFIPLDTDFDTVMKRQRSSDSRRKLRRLEEKIREEKGFKIEVIQRPDQVHGAMKDILDIERNSWKAENATDIASHQNQIVFYTKLAELMAETGLLRIAILYISSTPVAHEYNLTFGDRCFHLKGSYDNNFKRLSPSKVLKKEVLRMCCEEGLAEYDYTGQEQEHKLEWTDSMRPHQHWLIFNKTMYGNLLSKFENIMN